MWLFLGAIFLLACWIVVPPLHLLLVTALRLQIWLASRHGNGAMVERYQARLSRYRKFAKEDLWPALKGMGRSLMMP